jgi:hypothetical protein
MFKKESPPPDVIFVPQPRTEPKLSSTQLEATYGIGFKILSKSGYTVGQGLTRTALATPLSTKQLCVPHKVSIQTEKIKEAIIETLKIIFENFHKGAFIWQLVRILGEEMNLTEEARKAVREGGLVRDVVMRESEIFCTNNDYVTLRGLKAEVVEVVDLEDGCDLVDFAEYLLDDS